MAGAGALTRQGMVTMVRLSGLRTAAEIHDHDMRDLDYRREFERTRLAAALDLDFSVTVKPGRMRLRYTARDRPASTNTERKRA